MATVDLSVPQLGVVEVVWLVEWLAAEGDSVEAGQPVVVIESEKAQIELEAPASGRLAIDVEADPDGEVPVGTVLGRVLPR